MHKCMLTTDFVFLILFFHHERSKPIPIVFLFWLRLHTIYSCQYYIFILLFAIYFCLRYFFLPWSCNCLCKCLSHIFATNNLINLLWACKLFMNYLYFVQCIRTNIKSSFRPEVYFRHDSHTCHTVIDLLTVYVTDKTHVFWIVEISGMGLNQRITLESVL